jgi:hypothetical protein
MQSAFPFSQLFRLPSFLLGSFWLLLQQVIVACSVGFLAVAASNIEDPPKAVAYFVLFVSCMVLPYGPGIMANLKFEEWYLDSVRMAQHHALDNNPFQPTDFPEGDIREEREAIFSNAIPDVVGAFCGYIMSLLSSGLNAVLTLIAVGSFVDWRLSLTYILSLIACAIFAKYFGPVSALASNKTEDSRVQLASHGATFWPNFALHNKHCVANWSAIFTEKFDRYEEHFRKQLKIQSWSQLVITGLSLMPSAALLLVLVWSNMDKPTILAALFVTAPRVFSILLSLSDLSTSVFDWNHVKGRMDTIKDFYIAPFRQDWPIEQSKLEVREIKGTEVVEISDLEQRIAQGLPGRIVIRGPNGSGKTSLMLMLKKGLGETAFFLPSQSQLIIAKGRVSGSTGEIKFAELTTLLSLSPIPSPLFLDEWDANLDPMNMHELDMLVNEIALKALVVEVRHREHKA